LVYLAHGWHLAVHDKPLIEEKFEAWPYGPVESSLYHLFKNYRDSVITGYAKTWTGDKEQSYVVAKSDEKFSGIFEAVTKKYGAFSALALSALTHQHGTPWSTTRANAQAEIPNDLIRDHFRGLISNG